MAWELVSFASLKALLGLEDSLVTDYPALNILKPSVEAAIESYLGRQLESAERTETFYITGPSNIIPLKAIPVTAVSSLEITMLNETETYSTGDYYFTEYGLTLDAPIYDGYKSFTNLNDAKIAITYTGGLSAVPSDIERAALLQTAYEFLGKDQIGATSVTTEGGTVNRPALNLLPVVKDLLNPYKHPLKIR